MKQNNRWNFFEINIFSWIMIISYMFTFCFMTGFPMHSLSIENLYFSLPVVCAVLFWSQKSTYLLYLSDKEINKKQALLRDIFIFNFSLLISFFFTMILHFKYTDTRGFWSILIYPYFLYGLIFSVCYAGILNLKKYHKIYTLISAVFLLIFFPLLEFLISLSIFKNMGQLYAILSLTMGFLTINGLIIYLAK